MNWNDVAEMVKHWNDKFCLKGVMSVDDAMKAVDIGCSSIVVIGKWRSVSLTAPALHLTSLQRLSMRSVVRKSMSYLTADSARNPCVEGAFTRRKSGRNRSFLFFPLAAAGTAGCGTRARPFRAEIERDMQTGGVQFC